MKIGLVLRELHRAENDLAHDLLQASARHEVDHEVFHIARDLAVWSQRHVREIAALAPRYGEELDPEPEDELKLSARIRERGSELVGRRPDVGMLLLRDLRSLHLAATGVSVDWELLGQAAQGLEDLELLALTERCHPDTLRQAKWANAKLKESATQVLVT
ncbi:hypothetical protein [Cellulomonas fimi]|uniref:DUF2383 domain-containing protein n=1 Tax=Cellulomonas fimi TaxID=1708 RepID=A0A7Y0LW20_CELFI|nr:hypothetical protein [Cellulomonas fimi]NMR19286.1 hypothetical protein [Cellulomonas fimi]